MAVALAALVGGLVAGCASQSGPIPASDPASTPQASLVNTYWKLVTIDDAEIKAPTDRREAHLILRNDNRVTGIGPCNSFNGSWAMDGDQLVIGPLMATKMACPELDAERDMFAALDGKVTAVIDGQSLTVTGEDGTVLKFLAVYLQ